MVRPITAGYFDVVEIPIVHGRGFEEADRAGGEDVAVIDEAPADRLWPGENPIGRLLLFQDGVVDRERLFRVVGVAAQARQAIWTGGGSVAPDDFPVVYVPYRRQAETYVDWQVAFRMRTIFLLRTERNVANIAPEIRQVVASFDAELPISIQPLTEILRVPLSNQRFYTGMLSAFGALALLLATSGVFAVMAYTVSRKTRELGIRLALGAHAGQLRRAELWCGARLAGLGLLIGGAGAAWLSRFITGFLHGVGTLDPATYGLVAGIVLGAVLLAGYLPARRAAAVDRVRSLRTE